MKVALINPSTITEKYSDSSHLCVHLGIGYIASALEKEGIEVDIFECDLNKISVSRLLDSLFNGRYNAIGITTYYYNIMQTYRIVHKIKKKNKELFVFCGGIYASMNYFKIMQCREIDCCCIGEGEITVPELIRCLENNESIEQVEGIVYRKRDEIVINCQRKCLENIDSLAFPKRSWFFKGTITSMIATRGCNGNCSFCGIINYYKEYGLRHIRIRTPQNVVDEMEWLIEEKNIQYIYFQDENFLTTILIDKKWVENFCAEIFRRGIKVKFFAYGRADDILKHKNEVQMLKQAGLDCMFIGIESFSERQLQLYCKNTTKTTNLEVIKFMQELDLKLVIGFILFDPYLYPEEIETNVRSLLNSKFYSNCFFGQTPISCLTPLYPMPSTSLLEKIHSDNLYDESRTYKYRFESKIIEDYYIFLHNWSKAVFEKYAAIDSEYVTIKYEELEKIENCRKRLGNLLKLDLEFIAASQPINQLQDDELQVLLNKYFEKIKEI